MKTFLVVVCSLACAYAAVVEPVATVLKSISQTAPDGSYQYGFESDNGIVANAEGKLKNLGKDEVALEIVGSNEFVAPSGEKFVVKYVANEFGYQPEGAHLPVPPAPIPYPDYVVRALKYIEEHPYKEESFAKKV